MMYRKKNTLHQIPGNVPPRERFRSFRSQQKTHLFYGFLFGIIIMFDGVELFDQLQNNTDPLASPWRIPNEATNTTGPVTREPTTIPTQRTTKPTTTSNQRTTEPTTSSTQRTTEPTTSPTQLKMIPTPDWMRFDLNPNVHPCEDFYNYATTAISDAKQMVNTFKELTDLRHDQLLSLVNEEFDEDNITALTLPNALYQRCMDKSRIVLQGDDWHKHSTWSWENMLKNLRRQGYSTNYFFDVSVGVDSKNTSRRIIYIDQPTLSINHEYLIAGHPNARVYLNYSIEMAQLLGAEEERAQRDVVDSVHFEMALANISLPNDERQNATALYNPVSLKEFQSYYNYTDWVDLFNALFMDTGIVIDYNEIIIVRNRIYLEKLGELLANSTYRTVANYVMQRVINYSASFLSEALLKLQQKYSAELCDKPDHPCLDIATESLPDSVDVIATRKHVRNLIYYLLSSRSTNLKLQFSDVRRAAQEQQNRCLDVTTNRLPIAVGALYIRKYFNDTSRRAVTDMVDEIKSAIKEMLIKNNWLTPANRKSALEKLESMVFHIGYPDELMDDEILKEYYKNLVLMPEDSYLNTVLHINRFTTNKNFEKLRQTVNKTDWTTHSSQTGVDAFYSPTENSIQISASYLQGHLFSYDRPQYVNYGTIGVVIGREIARGFFDQGRQFDKSGNPVNWWQTATEEAFQDTTVCMREKYDNYTEPNLNSKLSGNSTFVENVADYGGIKAAYYAYRRWTATNGFEQQLPGLDLTPDQMFWVSAAQSYRSEGIWGNAAANRISPAQFRVLGSMSAVYSFSDDYKCHGTAMDPPRKCQIW